MRVMSGPQLAVGDVIFLERSIAGLPYPTGYWVLVSATVGSVEIALVSQDGQGMYAIGNRFQIYPEDLGAFSSTGLTARLTK